MSSLKKLSEGVAQCALRVGCDTRDRIGECRESETMEETSSMIFINWQASLNAARMSIRRTIHPFYESSEQSSRTKLKQLSIYAPSVRSRRLDDLALIVHG
ncbi:LOW QUALITY PROTEIN: hypothetical protein FGSG_13735 [Fusarium graminearum PH-1]|uniref:hypothetical protein n=1 Tax=Gibberella zeae (strain ATCC MYA-4620 / CBS 123657 / FGSC 9075 / NRRL 31084 / PH-1) TaxID=229533 RepID=UPI00021F2008|nr:LOW QUALITY PROTEIN: hypothetical protein FGSG_13735 [Fusarium graminearum PH-1]ESU16983.1 LOW QUALITY PROTEIN: hypothetical protein FGSG_13735 [Fusarium graminearum PH-1]|eukprot:XP_011319245.1 LOW QUALITY PROTEIN: hypothetical protein FGSG_13735 [Fusarium graminearum PH-1]